MFYLELLLFGNHTAKLTVIYTCIYIREYINSRLNKLNRFAITRILLLVLYAFGWNNCLNNETTKFTDLFILNIQPQCIIKYCYYTVRLIKAFCSISNSKLGLNIIVCI